MERSFIFRHLTPSYRSEFVAVVAVKLKLSFKKLNRIQMIHKVSFYVGKWTCVACATLDNSFSILALHLPCNDICCEKQEGFVVITAVWNES